MNFLRSIRICNIAMRAQKTLLAPRERITASSVTYSDMMPDSFYKSHIFLIYKFSLILPNKYMSK